MKEVVPFVDQRAVISWLDDIGYGVFAKEKIPSGTIIEIAPVIVCESPNLMSDRNASKYVIAWRNSIAIPLGWTMIYNHSDENSCEFSSNYYDNLLAIVAIKDIRAGGQITVNYGPDWFSSRGIEKRPMDSIMDLRINNEQ